MLIIVGNKELRIILLYIESHFLGIFQFLEVFSLMVVSWFESLIQFVVMSHDLSWRLFEPFRVNFIHSSGSQCDIVRFLLQ